METKLVSAYEKYKSNIMEYQKKRYEVDEEFRQRLQASVRNHHKTKYNNDPIYREQKKEKNRLYQQKLREARDKLISLGISI